MRQRTQKRPEPNPGARQRNTSPAAGPAISVTSVSKVYGRGANAVTALNDVSIDLQRGSFTAVMGPSGSGKSTLLQCAAGLDRPTSGRVRLGDTELTKLRESALTEFRRERVGFVFQAYNLLSSLTVQQNITLPLRLADRSIDEAWLGEVITGVGLDERLDHRPSQLSGGQQQRVAIARALITHPDAVFADEPTGALDSRTGQQILGLFRQIVETSGQTVLLVTHDPIAASFADRVVFLADGRLAGRLEQPSPDVIAERMTHLGEW